MKLTRKDILSYNEYLPLQPKFLQEVIKEKKVRRVQLSDKISCLFESKLTVLFQIQEMIRLEQIVDDAYINEMLEVYNDLLPEKDELTLTLFIEIPDQEKLREFNKNMVGIENNVQIVFGEHIVNSYEPDGEGIKEDEYTQSVHYLHFPFTTENKEAFLKWKDKVYLQIIHPNYQKEVILSEETVKILQKQLQEDR